MRKLGWTEGRDFKLEVRWTEGIVDRYSEFAAELVRLDPDLIVATSTPGAQAAHRATTRIPVVFVAVSDPVASGIVASLARPGGNVTGVSNFLPSTSAKLIELLKAAAPNLERLCVLHNPQNAGKMLEVQELKTGGQASGLWSDCRVGLAPTGKRRLCTAHAISRHNSRVTTTLLSGGTRS